MAAYREGQYCKVPVQFKPHVAENLATIAHDLGISRAEVVRRIVGDWGRHAGGIDAAKKAIAKIGQTK